MTPTPVRRLVLSGLLVSALSAGCGAPAPAQSPSPSASVAGSSSAPIATPARSTPAPSIPAKPTSAPTCAGLATAMTLSERVGQLFMVGISSKAMTAANARVLSRTKAGSVIFLGNTRAGAAPIRRLVKRVRSATPTPRRVQTMLTVDQEGGTVQRLRGRGFDTIPSARRQARLSDAKLRRDAGRWGRQLKAAGINTDLAPVADVVPSSLVKVNQPIGRLDRGYGPRPTVVARKTAAFVHGMNAAGIATSVKHFPGLGRVRGNTDFVSRVVDRHTKRGSADLKGFAGAVRAGVDMVMVSSAYYPKIDPKRRAAFSPVVMGTMIRGDLKFTGVVISDDLSARAMQDLTPRRRALLFLNAGGDLAIVGNPTSASAMTSAVVAEAKRNPRFAASVQAKATRVLALKGRRGLAPCR